MTTTVQAGAQPPAAGLTGRPARLLAEVRRQRGRWNATRTVRLYRRITDLPDTRVRAVARGDLRDLAAWGYLTLHDQPNNRYYTLRKDVRL
ncbi:MAG: hypothetical protein HOQ47_09460 [Streptomyces sp.]|nr:hypothetical protein [Streptomyces sp.]